MAFVSIDNIGLLAPPFVLDGEPFVISDYGAFYKRLATDMDDMFVSINTDSDALVRLHALLIYMIDLTYDLDFNVNQAVVDINYVLRDDVLDSLNIFPKEKFPIHPGVFALNEHTKRYVNADLTYYVNNEVWPDGCVPYEWALASEETGEDISGWNVCEPS
jgi:hypothetical protein